MRVYIVLKLQPDFVEAVKENGALALAEMQRLGIGIVKETEFCDFLGQGGAVYEVGVKHYAVYVVCFGAVGRNVDLYGLAGSEADYGAFLAVAFLTAVTHRSVYAVFKHQGIQAVIDCNLTYRAVGGLVHVEDRNQRMDGCKAVGFVESVDRVKI